MAEYPSCVGLEGGTAGIGRGNEMISARSAVAGIELSTEFVVLRLVNFSTKGERISGEAFWVKGPMLKKPLYQYGLQDPRRSSESAYHLMD